ncbi:MAG: thiamine pyrophosphate-dependent enzyme, partial [Pseudomonadota bacterium]
ARHFNYSRGAEMSMIRTFVTAGALALATPALAFDIDNMTDAERTAFGDAVRSYLLENPQLLMEMIELIEGQNAEAQATNDFDLVAENLDALQNDGHSWVGGNPDGDIVLVEFLDYRCGFCRRAFPEAEAVSQLNEQMNAAPGDEDFLSATQSAWQDIQASTRETIGPDMSAIMDTMRGMMERDSSFVRDMTMPAYAWGNQMFPIYSPRSTMNPNSGAIGPGLPMANGAALASGKKTVVIHGDGGVMVHIGELSTTAQYQLPVVLVVFTDGGYGVLRGIQSQRFEGRNIGTDLATPNFAMLARSMGIEGEQVKGLDDFKDAFKRAMDHDGPYVLDVDLNELAPMTGFGKRIEFEQPQ